MNKYPKSASALFQTFNDVTLGMPSSLTNEQDTLDQHHVHTAQKWTDIQVLELPKCGRGAIRGLRPSLVRTIRFAKC